MPNFMKSLLSGGNNDSGEQMTVHQQVYPARNLFEVYHQILDIKGANDGKMTA